MGFLSCYEAGGQPLIGIRAHSKEFNRWPVAGIQAASCQTMEAWHAQVGTMDARLFINYNPVQQYH